MARSCAVQVISRTLHRHDLGNTPANPQPEADACMHVCEIACVDQRELPNRHALQREGRSHSSTDPATPKPAATLLASRAVRQTVRGSARPTRREGRGDEAPANCSDTWPRRENIVPSCQSMPAAAREWCCVRVHPPWWVTAGRQAGTPRASGMRRAVPPTGQRPMRCAAHAILASRRRRQNKTCRHRRQSDLPIRA